MRAAVATSITQATMAIVTLASTDARVIHTRSSQPCTRWLARRSSFFRNVGRLVPVDESRPLGLRKRELSRPDVPQQTLQRTIGSSECFLGGRQTQHSV